MNQKLRNIRKEDKEPEEEMDEVVQEQIYEPVEDIEIDDYTPTPILDMPPQIVPEEISKYACPFCDKVFPNKGLLSSHIKRKHSDQIEEST